MSLIQSRNYLFPKYNRINTMHVLLTNTNIEAVKCLADTKLNKHYFFHGKSTLITQKLRKKNYAKIIFVFFIIMKIN